MSAFATLLHKLHKLLLPTLSHDAEREIDKEAIRGIYYSSLAVCLVEALSAAAYALVHAGAGDISLIKIASSLTCSVLCLVGHFASKHILNRWPRDHNYVMIFKALYFAILSSWGIFESARHYAMGGQMLTFFAIEFLMATFLVIKPWISTLLMGGAFMALYLVLVALDGAARADTLNYFVVMLVAIAGMVVRFHVERGSANRAITLEYVGTHDELTGLRNRKALEEDASGFVCKDLVIRMADVNDFKTFNDTYGHLTGDAVLREASSRLRDMYPNSMIYRFGGDEFLIMSESTDSEVFRGETCAFPCAAMSGETVDVAMSIGCVEGAVRNREELIALVDQADQELYRVKRRIHPGLDR